MPRWQPETWQLGLLLVCVPFQYFLVHYSGSNEATRAYIINQFLKSLVKFKEAYLHWSQKIFSIFWKHHSLPVDKDESNLDDDKGYFATSLEPRNPRPPEVKYHIGQVVTHKSWKYRGVIIGWDEEAKAPAAWLKEMYGASHPEWRKMPNYAVLVDVRDRSSPQVTYVPEENIIAVKDKKILHPHLDSYFEKFDGTQYIPRPWLRLLYPHD